MGKRCYVYISTEVVIYPKWSLNKQNTYPLFSLCSEMQSSAYNSSELEGLSMQDFSLYCNLNPISFSSWFMKIGNCGAVAVMKQLTVSANRGLCFCFSRGGEIIGSSLGAALSHTQGSTCSVVDPQQHPTCSKTLKMTFLPLSPLPFPSLRLLESRLGRNDMQVVKDGVLNLTSLEFHVHHCVCTEKSLMWAENIFLWGWALGKLIMLPILICLSGSPVLCLVM